MLGSYSPIKFPPSEKPQLIVVIDTEEEFNWSEEPDRANTAVSSMDKIHLCQDIFDSYGIKPCYVIDYPIASQERGYAPLKSFFDSGRCEIGAHLHPWVTPPLTETLSRPNMFPGNLSEDLERAKLESLVNCIEKNFDHRTQIYKAGRYGIGPNTEKILLDLDFKIDLSVCPPVDYSAEQGPDFSDANAEPYWFGPSEQQILEIPLSGAFTGCTGKFGKSIYRLGNAFKALKAPGILSRLNIVDRLVLSPEGYSHKDHRTLTNYLYKRGVRTFTWSFHNPSLIPGFTPYVNTEAQLSRFLDAFKQYFDFFFNELGGEASTPTALRRKLELGK